MSDVTASHKNKTLERLLFQCQDSCLRSYGSGASGCRQLPAPPTGLLEDAVSLMGTKQSFSRPIRRDFRNQC